MTVDKGKRRRLRTLPDRMQRLLTFGIYASSFEVPPERRAVEMVNGLEWFIGLLRRNGYAAPRWLLSPLRYFRQGLVIHEAEQERPTVHLMLGLLEGLVAELPEEERPEGMRELLHLFGGIYAEQGMEPPEWLRVGLERYGEQEGEPHKQRRDRPSGRSRQCFRLTTML